MGRGEPFERRALAGEKAGRGPPNGLGPQIALGSVHVIDAGETALVEWLRAAPWECGKGVAGMLQRFCSQLVKRRHPGIKVARLTRDDQMGSRELKQYHLIAKQVRRTKELGWAGLSPRGLRALSPYMQPVAGFPSLPALPSGGAHEPCPGTPSPYPGPFAQGKSNSSRLPVFKSSILTPGGWSPGVPT